MIVREGVTSGLRQVATEQDVRAPWGGGKNGIYFRCYLCGHRFEVGDGFRWILTNNDRSTASGNPIVCDACDGPDVEVKKRWNQMNDEAETRFWWFTRGNDE